MVSEGLYSLLCYHAVVNTTNTALLTFKVFFFFPLTINLATVLRLPMADGNAFELFKVDADVNYSLKCVFMARES